MPTTSNIVGCCWPTMLWPQEAISYKRNLFITDTPGTMCQINIVGDVPFPVGNYTNIDQSAIKKPELVKTIIYSECNIKSKILLWQKPIQYSILYAVRFHKTVTMFFLKKQYDRKSYILYSHCSIVHSVRFGSGQFNFFFSGLNARDPYYFHL